MHFVKDPCGVICLFITYLAILYSDYVVVRFIIQLTMADTLWGPIHIVLFNTIIFLLGMSHMKAVLLDPGTVSISLSSLKH